MLLEYPRIRFDKRRDRHTLPCLILAFLLFRFILLIQNVMFLSLEEHVVGLVGLGSISALFSSTAASFLIIFFCFQHFIEI